MLSPSSGPAVESSPPGSFLIPFLPGFARLADIRPFRVRSRHESPRVVGDAFDFLAGSAAAPGRLRVVLRRALRDVDAHREGDGGACRACHRRALGEHDARLPRGGAIFAERVHALPSVDRDHVLRRRGRARERSSGGLSPAFGSCAPSFSRPCRPRCPRAFGANDAASATSP